MGRMPHVSQNELPAEAQRRLWKVFLNAFDESQKHERLENFLNGLLTPTEKLMLAKRFMIALLLRRGEGPAVICHALKVSRVTVNLVRRELSRAPKGYEAILRHPRSNTESSRALEVVDRFFAAITLPIKGSPSSMRRWKSSLGRL